MLQFFKKVRSSNDIIEVNVVNKLIKDTSNDSSIDNSNEYLLTIIHGVLSEDSDDKDTSVNNTFTYSSHTNQVDTLVKMLKQNGYKEGLKGLEQVTNSDYNTYEDGSKRMSHIVQRETLYNLPALINNDLVSYYFTFMGSKQVILHYNGVLRDKYGIEVPKNQELLNELQSIYDQACAFDIATTLDFNDSQFTIIDFAYESSYYSRRNVVRTIKYNKHESHRVATIGDLEHVLLLFSQILVATNENECSIIIHGSDSNYCFDSVKSGAYIVKVTADQLKKRLENMCNNKTQHFVQTSLATVIHQLDTISNEKTTIVDSNERGTDTSKRERSTSLKEICVKRRILV